MSIKDNQGFKLKGGLFTEFSNKNKGVIEEKRLEMLKNKAEKEEVQPLTYRKSDIYSPIRFKDDTVYSGRSMLEKAKEVIDKKHLFRIKEVYEKSGMMLR